MDRPQQNESLAFSQVTKSQNQAERAPQSQASLHKSLMVESRKSSEDMLAQKIESLDKKELMQRIKELEQM